ncbi:extracellular solute-binding protein [Patescibacteria group bacterium]
MPNDNLSRPSAGADLTPPPQPPVPPGSPPPPADQSPPLPDSPPAESPLTPSTPQDSPSSPPTNTPEPLFPITTPESDQPDTEKSSGGLGTPPVEPPVPPPPEAGDPAQPREIVDPIFKRILPFAIGIAAIILLFLLITKIILPIFKKEEVPDIVNLKYWGLWEPENIVSQVIDDYQQDYPNVSIEYVKQSPKDYRERLQSALAQNTGPDIFRWHNTWLPMLKNDLAPIPDEIYPPAEFDTTFYPIVKQNVFSANKYYGIPLEFDALALYVNEDILASSPSLKVPTTWDNLRQTAKKLTQTTNNQITRGGIAMGTTSNVDHFSDILGLMILQNGGTPSTPDSDTVTSAIKFYTLFSKTDKSWDSTLPASTHAFATEKVAMMLAPSWRAIEIKAINPQLNFKLYPVPQLPGTNISWATYWIEGVSKKSENQTAAFEFLKYLSSAETMQKMYTLASQVRLFGEPYSRQDLVSNLQQDPFVGAILSQALSAQSYPLVSKTYDNGLNDKLIKYYEDAVNSHLKQEAEKNITTNLSSGVAQVLSQYGLSSQ